MAGTLAKIEPVHAYPTPPKGDDGQPSKIVGHTSTGAAIYERTIIRPAKDKVPEVDPETGQQKWAKHPTTGEKLYSRWRAVRTERTQQFTLESDGRCNLYVQEYQPPSAEEVQAQKDAAAAETFQRDLAQAAVKEGLSVADLLAAIKGDDKPRRGRKAD